MADIANQYIHSQSNITHDMAMFKMIVFMGNKIITRNLYMSDNKDNSWFVPMCQSKNITI